MKKIALMFIVMALTSPVVALAADSSTSSGKNPCLLNSADCAASTRSYTVQEEIAMLQTEVNKGTTVYSGAELETLQSKLDESQMLLANLTSP